MQTTTIYNTTFWNAMRGKAISHNHLEEGSDKAGGYIAPSNFNDKYTQALTKENVFRRLGTVVTTSTSEATIQAMACTGTAGWVAEMSPISESSDTLMRFPVRSYKLGSLSRLKTTFIQDTNFNIESYLENDFARRFGRAEEDAFINGNGTDAPCGILNATGGAEIGGTAATLTYDEVLKLYFSVSPEHRRNGGWLMNDETAIALRTLKDSTGNYLWNSNDNTILGKPVQYSNYMPNAESGKCPIAFGDFSYYWIIQRQPLTLKILTEKYSIYGEIGFSGYERLDGKLILPEAVKLFKMA